MTRRFRRKSSAAGRFVQARFLISVGAIVAIPLLPGNALAAKVARDGAVGVNASWEAGKSPVWYIELQREGAHQIEDGMAREDDTTIQFGLTILDWGFDHQANDGSFAGTGDPFHSTSLFVEAAARAMLLLKNYHPVTYTANLAAYASVATSYTTKLNAAARWLTRPDIVAAGQQGNLPYTHRRYVLAAALAETAALSGDAALAAAAIPYVYNGLSLQLGPGWMAAITRNANGSIPPATLLPPGAIAPASALQLISAAGVNPEKGGYDVNYQCAGIFYALHYFGCCADVNLQARLAGMIERGLLWEMSRIDVQGNVVIAGSSREGIERDRYGKLKRPDISEITAAFADGCALTFDPCFAVVAARVVADGAPPSTATVSRTGAVGTNAKASTGGGRPRTVSVPTASADAKHPRPGPDRDPTWSIGLQKEGAVWIEAGIAREDDTLIRKGILIFNWGWGRQGTDGSFPGTSDKYRGTAQFVEAVARAALALRSYSPSTYTADTAYYSGIVANYTANVQAAAHWLIRSDIAPLVQKSIAPYTSRRYLLAAALGETAQLCDDAAVATAALSFAKNALPLQWPDGTNPENGVYDVNAQATGIGYAARYYPHCGDEEARSDLKAMIQRGLVWEMGWVDAQGNVSTGSMATADRHTVDGAFELGYDVCGDPRFLVMVNRIGDQAAAAGGRN